MSAAARPRPQEWLQTLVRARERMSEMREVVVEGTLSRMVGMTLEAVGCEAAVVIAWARAWGAAHPSRAARLRAGVRCLARLGMAVPLGSARTLAI